MTATFYFAAQYKVVDLLITMFCYTLTILELYGGSVSTGLLKFQSA
jgi:hypothetical protein